MGADRLLAGPHPVDVAAHGVDFAVVGNHAERVREIPGREGVGREALVNKRKRGYAPCVSEIPVEHADLIREQLSLVDNGACGE